MPRGGVCPTETAAEYAANFSTLIELMTEELADMAKRRD
jgi:hypothetical protein